MAELNEIAPPWIEYPGYGPSDMFWRQGYGDSFMRYQWDPFYESLPEPEQDAYLKRWNVPEDWYTLRFDRKIQANITQINEEYHKTHPVVFSRSTPESDTRTTLGPGKYIHRLLKFFGFGTYER